MICTLMAEHYTVRSFVQCHPDSVHQCRKLRNLKRLSNNMCVVTNTALTGHQNTHLFSAYQRVVVYFNRYSVV